MKKKIKINKKDSVNDLKKRVEDNMAGWKRAKADYENLKKRTQVEKKNILMYANEDLFVKLLPIVDNFESAYKNIPAEIEDNSWVQGIGFIKDQIDKYLQDNNIKVIKSMGENFDPEMHEAVESVESNYKKGKIIEVLLNGYKYKEKVIRPAKVKVAK